MKRNILLITLITYSYVNAMNLVTVSALASASGQCSIIGHRVGHNIHIYENEQPGKSRVQDPKGLLTHAYDPRHQERACAVLVGQGFVDAVKRGNLKAIKDEYELTWSSLFTSWSNCNTKVTEGLKYASSVDAKISGRIVEYLLTKVKPKDIDRPDCLLNSAVFHGHISVIKFINDYFPELTPWALYEAIDTNKNTHVVNLLKGGTDPNKGIGAENKDYVMIHKRNQGTHTKTFAPGAHNPVHLAAFTGKSTILKTLINYGGSVEATTVTGLRPLEVTLNSFKPDDTEDMLKHRFYIVRTILANMTAESVPSLEEVDMSRIQDEPRRKVVELIKSRRAKTNERIVMCEQAPKQEIASQDECDKDDSCNVTCGQVVFSTCVLFPLSVYTTIHLFCKSLRT